ncbi:MAG: GNAT family N-acetyltransferase [Candidatus Methylomirabilia bacterium]
MKVEVLDRFALVGESTWNDLLARSATPVPFLSWQWQSLWWEAFAQGRPLTILHVSGANGRVVGLLPLYETAASVWQIVGGVDISDYLDLLAARGHEEEIWSALLHHRAADTSAWELHCIRADSPTASLVPHLAPAAGLSVTVQCEDRCPLLTLPESWEAYLNGLSGKARHELRRKLRRLEREWPDATVTSHASPDGLDAAMTAFLTLHRRSKTGKARFMDERMEGFFRNVATALASRGWLRLWFLEHQGAAVAAYFCLEFEDSVGLYNSGFDPAQAALSPGVMLLSHVIRDAIDRRLAHFDFLRGEEPYKYSFGPVPQDVLNVVVRR